MLSVVAMQEGIPCSLQDEYVFMLYRHVISYHNTKRKTDLGKKVITYSKISTFWKRYRGQVGKLPFEGGLIAEGQQLSVIVVCAVERFFVC